MITANCHHDVLHAVTATKVRGTVRYNTTTARSEVTLCNKIDVPLVMQELTDAGWEVQCSHNDRKTFFVVGALVAHP